jgi:hypothetical protein
MAAAAATAAASEESVSSATDYLFYKSFMPDHKDFFFVKKPDEQCREIENIFYEEGVDDNKTTLEPIKADEKADDWVECERYYKYKDSDMLSFKEAEFSDNYYKKNDVFLKTLTPFIPEHLTIPISYMDIDMLRHHQHETYESLFPLYPMQWTPTHPLHKSMLRLSNQIKAHNFRLNYKKYDTGEICVVPKIGFKEQISKAYKLYTIKTSDDIILFRSVYQKETYSIVDRVKGEIKKDRLATLISTTYSLDFALNWVGCQAIHMIRVPKECPIFIVNDDSTKNYTHLPKLPKQFVMRPSEYQYEVTLLPGTFTIANVSKIIVNDKELYVFDTTYEPVEISEWDNFYGELMCKEDTKQKRMHKKRKRTHKKRKRTHKKTKRTHKKRNRM